MEKNHKSKKETKDDHPKEGKQIEIMHKSLESCRTPDEKVQLAINKYAELERKLYNAQHDGKKKDKLIEQLLREKDQLQREQNKCMLMRDKLQDICREQQAINKSLKNESVQQLKEEEKRRKELQTKFQQSLDDITLSLGKHNDENVKLREYNDEMSKKLKFFADHYKTREQQYEKLAEQLTVAQQLHAAKENKLNLELEMEREIMNRERQISQQKLIKAQEQIKELVEAKSELKEQVTLYSSKYDEFHKSMQKSNDLFTSYKAEIEKLSKSTLRNEKESAAWREKYEKSNAKLILLATERKDNDNQVARYAKQVEMLQKLLRALQAERAHLLKELRDNNIEISELPPLPPAPELMQCEPPVNTQAMEKDRMAVMTRNCEELKQTLANLQSKMDQLSVEEKPKSPKLEDNVKNQKRAANKKKQKIKRAAKEPILSTSVASATTEINAEVAPGSSSTTAKSAVECTAPAQTECVETQTTAEAQELPNLDAVVAKDLNDTEIAEIAEEALDAVLSTEEQPPQPQPILPTETATAGAAAAAALPKEMLAN